MSSHYETLGVAKDATQQQIKSAYRKMARKLHPDVNPGQDAAEQFKLVTRAYEVLSDETKRANYDATGDENGNGHQASAGPAASAGSGTSSSSSSAAADRARARSRAPSVDATH